MGVGCQRGRARAAEQSQCPAPPAVRPHLPHTQCLNLETLTVSQSKGTRKKEVLSWVLLPEPLRRLGLLSITKHDLLHLKPQLTQWCW